jgi:hypothetical protein
MAVPQAIALLAIGGPGRYVCPKCNGGSDNERCLSIQGDSWQCFRATCGYRGGNATMATHPKIREPRHYTRPYGPLNDDQNGILADRFGLPDGVVDGYSVSDDRFILGIEGPQHQLRGHVAYSLSGGKPKSLNYWAKTEEPFNHWAMTLRPPAIVVVEDWFSAEKVREAGATGVALMGTLLTQAMITDISYVARNWGVPTYLALDKDAFAKSLAYKVKYNEQFKFGLQVWALQKDLKYVSVELIQRAIEYRDFDFRRSHREQGSV